MDLDEVGVGAGIFLLFLGIFLYCIAPLALIGAVIWALVRFVH